ncbi:MAG: transglycosylase domain-containing protein, partial [Elusimicrobia bacterium]|nr:transglycosylase domain-containing protein [Elusimicrobiota bacterium]
MDEKRARPGGATLLAAGGVAAAAVVIASLYLCWLPDVSGLRTTNPMTTRYVAIYVRRMTRSGKRPVTAMRWVPLAEISPHLVRAVLIAEDDRYWLHSGVDWGQLEEAAVENWRAGRTVRGASTISQQVARNLFLSPRKTYWRKLKEILLARWL